MKRKPSIPWFAPEALIFSRFGGINRGGGHHCAQHAKVEELHLRGSSASVGLNGPQMEVKVGGHPPLAAQDA